MTPANQSMKRTNLPITFLVFVAPSDSIIWSFMAPTAIGAFIRLVSRRVAVTIASRLPQNSFSGTQAEMSRGSEQVVSPVPGQQDREHKC